MNDTYTWEAKYKDGSLIQEWAGNAYKDIDRSKLDEFVVYHVDDKTKPVMTVSPTLDQQLIWRKRRVDTTDGVRLFTTYIAGWVNGEGKHATFIAHSELFNMEIAKYESNDFDVELWDFEIE